jgi:SAM-dependent methyltransferase
MKHFLKIVYCILANLRRVPAYIKDRIELGRQRGKDRAFPFGGYFPILHDRCAECGTMSGAYFHQDLLVARRIFRNQPERHVDIGSRTDGFVAHVASFRKIEILDVRAQKSCVENVEFRQADLMNLPADMIDCCDSLSSLHAIEHFGLGRYGDPIDYHGHEKAIANIHRMLRRGGVFYFSVPIGPQRIEFNAHRVFAVSYLLGLLEPRFEVRNFSYVDDRGDLHENVALEPSAAEASFGCHFGCGIFELVKK